MIIGAEIGGRMVGRESAISLLDEYKKELSGFVKMIKLQEFTVSLNEGFFLISAIFSGKVGNIRSEFMKRVDVDVELSEISTSDYLVYDVRSYYLIEINTNFMHATIYLKLPESFQDAILEVLNGHPVTEVSGEIVEKPYEDEMVVGVDSVYRMDTKVKGLVLKTKKKSEEFKELEGYGGLKVEVEKLVKPNEEFPKRILTLFENLIEGKTSGVFDGLDTECLRMRDMVFEKEKRHKLNLVKTLSFFPGISRFFLNTHDTVEIILISPKINFHKKPVFLTINGRTIRREKI